MVLVDNNILSSLAKVGRLDLLKELFGEVMTTPSVMEEFRDERIEGYDFVDRIYDARTFGEVTEDKWLQLTSLSNQENQAKEEVLGRGGPLGVADSECLVIADNRDEVLLTDDTYLGSRAMSEDIDVYDLETLLEACIRDGVIEDSEELKEILEGIENRDYYSFAPGFKEKLLSVLEEK